MRVNLFDSLTRCRSTRMESNERKQQYNNLAVNFLPWQSRRVIA